MKTQKKDLSQFSTNYNFYPETRLLITIKSFDLKAIRERYLKNRNKKSNRTGSVNRRETAIGGIAEVTLHQGKLKNLQILTRLPEPRGIDSVPGLTAFSSENKVYLLSNDQIETIENPWFSYIHTTDIEKPGGNHLLVSSSGFDCIFEYDVEKKNKTFEWFAWENGFNQGMDPKTGDNLFLTRNKGEAQQYKKEGNKYIYIQDPANQVLPTAQRAAFINSVVYDPTDPNAIIATFFHEGAVYKIDRQSGQAKKLLDGLINPHGGMKLTDGPLMGTSTKGGEVVLQDTKGQTRYDFSDIPGKPEFLSDFEWIQNSIVTREGNILAVDSNRNAFVIFHPEKEWIDFIPYDANWAIQDLVPSGLAKSEKKQMMGLTDQ